MTCPRCRTENPSHAKFCLECAASLGEIICASCGAKLPSIAKFCLECAHPTHLASAGPAQLVATQGVAVHSATALAVAQQVLQHRDLWLVGNAGEDCVIAAERNVLDRPIFGLTVDGIDRRCEIAASNSPASPDSASSTSRGAFPSQTPKLSFA